MIIVGAKGFAKEVLEVIWQRDHSKNIVFFDNISKEIEGVLFGKFNVLRSIQEVENHFIKTNDFTFTLGIGNPLNRYKLYNQFIEIGGKYVSTISPYARIGHFDNEISEGCNIMSGSIITNSVKISRGVLINLNCTIGHDCIIGEFVEMSPGTHISGNCNIGSFSVLGTNSAVLPKVSIGENVIIGAGAVVTKDIESNSLAVGVPAKIIKELPKIKF